MDTLVNLSPTAIIIIFFIIILIMAYIRHIESRHISDNFSEDKVKLVSYGVTWFGQENKIEKPLRITGAIALVEDGIYFHSRFGSKTAFISSESIKTIGTTDYFCDKALNDTVIQVSFKNTEGELDRMVFRIPSPAKWLKVLQSNLAQD